MNRPPYSKKKRFPPHRSQLMHEFWRSRQSLQKFVQAIPVPLFVTATADSVIQAANQKFLDLVEYEPGQLIGRSLHELNLIPGLPHHWDALRLQAVAGEQDREISLLSRSGQEVTALVSVERFLYHGRESLLVSLVDFSNRKRVEDLLRARYDLLVTTGRIGPAIAELQDLPSIYARLSDSLHQLLPQVRSVAIRLYDRESQALETVYATDETCFEPVYLSVGESAGQSKLQTQTVRAASGRSLSEVTRIMLPLAAKGEALGLLEVCADSEESFSEADLALISWLGNTAAVAIHNARLVENLQKTHDDLDRAYEATLEGWSRALELRDHDTQGHTERVVTAATELASRMGISGHDLDNIRRGAQLHDIGKMGIPDHILLKPGPLTEQEWSIMRKHPVYAHEMLSPIPQFREILDIPYAHHEKWDGSGYPRRLKGEEIPLAARIFAVVDVWDALSSDRPYRNAWPAEQVIEYLRYESGRHFDPQVVNQFLTMLG